MHAHELSSRQGSPHTLPTTNGASSSSRVRTRWLALFAWVLLCVGGGALIGLVSSGDGPWYRALQKPSWTPPPWLFAPVWTTLYLLMGVAAWLVWQRGGWRTQRRALTLFLVQLGVNFSWSPVFFGAQRIELALVVIACLWFLISATIVSFSRVRAGAAWLLAPYLVWVSYATALNAAIAALN